MHLAKTTLFVIALTALGACSKSSAPPDESAAPAASAPAQSTVPQAPTSAQPQSPMPAPAPPSVFTENAQEAEQAWTGVVVSTIDVAQSKTMYLELDVNGKREWVASQAIDVKAGDKVKVGAGALQMENFASSSLGRTFEKIWLASDVEKVD